MANGVYGVIVRDGLWSNNAAFVQLLGLCPLLAVTGTVVNGLGLGMATTLVLIGSNVTVSLIRNLVRPEVRIPVFVMVIASFVTAIELAMNAYFYDLYKILGIFIPLIVTNCAIIGRAEAFASKNSVTRSFVDALTMGLGFTLALALLGGVRELFGQGTLLAQAGPNIRPACASNVPCQNSSRTPPSSARASVKPRPMVRAAPSARVTQFLDANAPARTTMAQLDPLQGRHTPTPLDSPYNA